MFAVRRVAIRSTEIVKTVILRSGATKNLPLDMGTRVWNGEILRRSAPQNDGRGRDVVELRRMRMRETYVPFIMTARGAKYQFTASRSDIL
jgi:hypothetical protein